MREIVLARIDDRLIHGQIMTQWSRMYRPTTIMVVDDTVYEDPFMSQILLMAVPKDYKTVVASVEKGAEYLTEPTEGERILLLVKTPEAIEGLIDKGVVLKALNVGGMAAKENRKTLYRNISSSAEENQTLLRIQAKGTRVYIQIVPDDKETELEKLL